VWHTVGDPRAYAAAVAAAVGEQSAM
jgi:hypothetical protein